MVGYLCFQHELERDLRHRGLDLRESRRKIRTALARGCGGCRVPVTRSRVNKDEYTIPAPNRMIRRYDADIYLLGGSLSISKYIPD